VYLKKKVELACAWEADVLGCSESMNLTSNTHIQTLKRISL